MKKSEKIVGNMKDPKTWLNRNNRMAYVSLFWFIVSLAIFIYLKFFTMPTIISILYVIGYIFFNSYISCNSWYEKTGKKYLKHSTS